MKKFIKIESNFKDNKKDYDYDMVLNIHNIEKSELLEWLAIFLQILVDDNIFNYDTLLRLVRYAVVDSKKDREKEYNKNLDSLFKEFTDTIDDMLSEGKNDN